MIKAFVRLVEAESDPDDNQAVQAYVKYYILGDDVGDYENRDAQLAIPALEVWDADLMKIYIGQAVKTEMVSHGITFATDDTITVF